MKEWMIQILNNAIDPQDGDPIGWINAYGNMFTDWVQCAVQYRQLATSNPNERYRIVCRDVSDWEECYR